MSLQVWLPLTNNTDNQGISMAQFTNNGATKVNEGNFGQSYYLNKITLSCPNFTVLESTNSFSACCWVKFTSFPTESNAYCICLNTSTSSAYKFVLGVYSDNGTTASFRLNLGNSVGTLQLNTWYHLAICVNDTTGYMYINGELKKTVTGVKQQSATNLIIGGRSTNAAGTTFTGVSAPGYYNDIRIYDHCLSKKEISELSKGLILHYPLDNGIHGNWNLIKGNYSAVATSASIKTSGSCTFDTSLMPLNSLIGKTIWFSYDYSVEGDRLNNTGTYTKDRFGAHLSLNYKNTSGATKTTYPCANALEIRGTGRTVQSYVMPSDASEIISFSVSCQPYNQPAAENTNTWYLKNFKLEVGETASSWTPNPTDASIDILKVVDCSGYGRTGFATKQMSFSTDTPRYEISTCWKDNTDFINIPAYCALNQTISEITICGWFKTNTMNSTAPNMFNFGANNFIRGRIAGSAALWSYWNINGTKVGVTASTETTTDNKWHHYAFSFKDGIIKTYFDGVLKNTSDQSATGTVLLCAQTINWGLGGYTSTGEKFIGQQSDFRVYAVALSDIEVLELYEGRPGVDKNGNFYIGELQETSSSTPLITKTNIANVPNSFYEPTGMNLAYDVNPHDYDGVIKKYTPKKDTSNSTISAYKIRYGPELNGRRARATVTVDWSGFDSSSTAGTFAIRFQGGQLTLDNNQSWTAATGKTNRLASGFANAQNLTDLVLGAASGSKTITIEYTISSVAEQPGDWLGIRADYSNGTGWIQMSNLQVALMDAITDNDQNFKISKENIAANYIYEF